MPRKQLVRTAEFPYHVVNRSNNQDYFYLEIHDLWKLCLEALQEVSEKFNVCTHAFVLMSNHYHLIISTPNSNLDEAMLHFNREIARRANRKADRTNHFFGGRYKWCIIKNERHYWNALKYVFRNPVAVNITQRVENYSYSSLNYTSDKLKWHLCDFFFDRSKGVSLDLEWLNHSFDKRQSDAIAKALRRRTFKLSADDSKKIVELDEPQYEKGRGTS